MIKNILVILLFLTLINCEQNVKNTKIKNDTNPVQKNKILSKDIEKFNKVYGKFYNKYLLDDRIDNVDYFTNEKGEIISIKIAGNIQADSLLLFKNLRSIKIKNNNLLFNKVLNFESYEKLETLIIYNNSSVSQNIEIKNYKNLKNVWIDYRNAELKYIIFSNISNIKDLTIYGNLYKIPSNIKYMNKLKILGLNFNKINYINFNDLPKSLEEIHLQNNPIIEKEKLKIEGKKRNIKVYL